MNQDLSNNIHIAISKKKKRKEKKRKEKNNIHIACKTVNFDFMIFFNKQSITPFHWRFF